MTVRSAFRRRLHATPAWDTFAHVRGSIERRLGVVYEPRAFWQARADEYVAARRARPAGFEREEIAALLSDVRSCRPRTVIEVGCGYGRVMSMLRDLEPNVRLAGLDLSRQMLMNAPGTMRGALIEGDVTQLPFADRSADVLYTYGLFMHVPPSSIAAAMREVSRVSGEWIACLETGFPPDHRAVALSSYAFSRSSFAHDYEGLFKAQGWRTVRVQRLAKRIALLVRRTREDAP